MKRTSGAMWRRWSGMGRRGLGAVSVAAFFLAATGLGAQEVGVRGSAVTLSAREATLQLELADGGSRTLSLREGKVLLDGTSIGSYVEGGELERSWRSVLRSPDLVESDRVLAELARWEPPAEGSDDAAAALRGWLAALGAEASAQTSAQVPETASVSGPNGRQVAIAPGVMSLPELTRSVERLERSLRRLAPGVADLEEQLALVVHDDYVIPRTRVVPGDLALLGGNLRLEGVIEGDVLVLDGTLVLEPSARVGGDLLQVGGEVIDAGGRVTGELVSLVMSPAEEAVGDLGAPAAVERRGDLARVRGPGFLGRVGRNIGRTTGGVTSVLAWFLGLAALGVVIVYFFRSRLEVAADTVRVSFTRSFGVGLAGQLLFFPVLLVLVVGIVTWLVIPFYLMAVALALPAGYLAVAHAAGEVLAAQRYDWIERLRFRRDNSYYYVMSGLAVLLAPFAFGSVLHLLGGFLGFVRGITFFAAGVFTWMALTAGFGAVILSRGGGRGDFARAVDVADLFTSADFDDGETAHA